MNLTNKQKVLLDYVVRFKEVNGYSPSVREIAKGTYTGVARVHTILEELMDKGYITFKEKQPRTIRVLKFVS